MLRFALMARVRKWVSGVIAAVLAATGMTRPAESADCSDAGSATVCPQPADMIRLDHDHLPDRQDVSVSLIPVNVEQAPPGAVFADDEGWIVQLLHRHARTVQRRRWVPQPFMVGPPR